MKKQKYIALAASITVAATAIAPVASANTLTDIDSSPYKAEIEKLVERGVISGYKDHTFKPNKTLTRSDVVKILGKYLVSLGYEIPTNYKSNLRFSDLNRNMDDELLKYAALVKDVGVFNGDRGRLLAKNQLTNAQAANVLVRAFSKIDAFDYIAFVEQQTFFKEFEDTANITGETKQSINVIDYYEIVSRDNYYPNQSIARGSFASMLYRMINVPKASSSSQLAVQSIVAVSPTRLTVTLSDTSQHNIFLDEPLVENVSTPVSFTINGVDYDGRATYYTKQLEVVDVESLNSGQFVVYFNQEVDLPTTNAANDLNKIFTLTKSNATINTYNTFLKGELSADKKSYIITLSSKNPLNGTYRLRMEGVRALNGKSLADFDESVYFVPDTTKPTIKNIENVTNTLVKVTFSEPVYTSNSAITYTLPSGKTTTSVTARANDRTYYATDVKTEILFEIKNTGIRPYEAVSAKILGLRDIAGNTLSVEDSTFKLQRGGPDYIAPKFTGIEQIAAKQFVISFNEPMETIYPYQLKVTGTNEYYNVTDVKAVDETATSFIVTVDNFLDGRISVASQPNYPLKDATGTEGKFSTTHVFDYDTTRAVIEYTETIREDNMLNLYVYFDRNVVVGDDAKVKLHGSYLFKGSTVAMNNPQQATVYATKDPRVVKIPVKELVRNYDRIGSVVTGQLAFTNVTNEYLQPVEEGTTSFERISDTVYNTEKLELLSVETSRTSKDILDSRILVLNFSHPLDNEGVTDLYNYDLIGYKIKSAQLNTANPRQVILTVDTNISAPIEPYLYVYNLKSSSSMLDMDTYYERVFLNENIAPTYVSSEIVNAYEMKLTFNEALNEIDTRTFYVENVDGSGSVAHAAIDPTNNRSIILTLDTPLIPYSTVKIRLMPGRTITDLYHNEGNFGERSIYVGSLR